MQLDQTVGKVYSARWEFSIAEAKQLIFLSLSVLAQLLQRIDAKSDQLLAEPAKN